MRRKDKEITDRKIIDEIISKSIVCRVAMFDEEYPYILPFNYGYHQNALYIHSALKGKKLDLIKKNNKVAFVIELPHEIITGERSCDWTTKYKSVVGFGKVEILTSEEEKRNGLDIIMAQHGKPEGNNYSDKSIIPMLILKLTIESVTGKQSGEF